MSQSHSGGIRLPSSLSRFLCYCREKWAVAGRGSGVDRAAPPARRGRCGAKRWPRPTRAGAGAGFGASGGLWPGVWEERVPASSPGSVGVAGAEAQVTRVRAGHGRTRSGKGAARTELRAEAGPRAARAAAWGPQQSRVRARGARLRHRRQRLPSLLPKQSKRHPGLGFRRLQWCPAGSRCHDLVSEWRSLRSRRVCAGGTSRQQGRQGQ